jgi:hypothetical protein
MTGDLERIWSEPIVMHAASDRQEGSIRQFIGTFFIWKTKFPQKLYRLLLYCLQAEDLRRILHNLGKYLSQRNVKVCGLLF